MKEYRDDAVFTASLDGIKLSKEQIERIDNGIKNVVLAELAEIDHEGDVVMNRKLDLNPKFDKIDWGGRTHGIWIEDFDRYRGRIQGF